MGRPPEPYDLADTGQRPETSQPIRPAAVLALFGAVVACALFLVGQLTGWAGELVWWVIS